MTSVPGEAVAAAHSPPQRAVAVWLLVVAGLVLAMAALGAVTRLTESGLSMVEWKPVTGLLPPLSDTEWNRVFSLYRDTPEFRLRHAWMDLGAFKTIFFWEWLHRLWGHLIALAFLGPFLWFVARGARGRLAGRLAGILALGTLQGLIGWYMVMSGLADRPEVSHYRLALHLLTAATVYALLIATALDQSPPATHPLPRLRFHARIVLALVLVTMVWGAFVAGLDAGRVYTTFPTMDGEWFPSALGTLSPWWRNPLENTAAVQFTHRCLALATLLAALTLAWRARATEGVAGKAGRLLGWLVAAQAGLGIVTLLTGAALHPAVAHQIGAFAVLGTTIWLLQSLRPVR